MRGDLVSETLSNLLDEASSLANQGLFDSASAILTKAIAVAPSRDDLFVKRAWLDHQAGKSAIARMQLIDLNLSGVVAIEALILDLEIDAHENMDVNNNPACEEKAKTVIPLVFKLFPWGEIHERFVLVCRDLNLSNLVLSFLRDWLQEYGVSKKVLVRAGEILLELEEANSAFKMLNYIWEQPEVQKEMAMLLGPRTNVIADNPKRDFEILDKIDTAFDAKEQELSLLELPSGEIDPKSVNVLYVGSSIVGAGLNRDNDMANHYKLSADLVGVNCRKWLSADLVVPQWTLPSRESLSDARIKFVEEIANTKPDLLILDACTLPTGRGISPKFINKLKNKYKFRVAGLLRDPLKYVQQNIEAWASVSDTLICGDPSVYFVKEKIKYLYEKALFLPVPAFHDPFVPQKTQPRRELVFIGSTFNVHRSMLLSMLGASSDIFIDLIIGDKRRKLVPNESSYAEILGSSRGVLNISGHHPSEDGHLVTGRVWETIACRSLLFEQRNAGTEKFFTPWRHFLPWRKPADIIHYWRVIKRHNNYRVRIANEGYQWASQHYSPRAFWDSLVNHALRNL